MKVDNKRKGAVTIEGHVLQPGIGFLPNELAAHWYVAALVKDQEMTIISDDNDPGQMELTDSGEEHDPYAVPTGPVAGDPVLDDEGNPVLDENGEPMVYQPEEE